MGITLSEIRAARVRIAGAVRPTPVDPSPALSRAAGVPVWLKGEHQQRTGSFKLRGAANAVGLLPAGAAGVVAASTGNHGRALAHAARARGLRAVVCMSRLVPANKLEAIEALGAEIRIVGASQDAAQAEAERLAADEGLALVPPFDDPRVIAGQGTLGLELVEQLPEARTIVVPIGGGGLASGIAIAAAAAGTAAVAGVEVEASCPFTRGLAAGRIVSIEVGPTLADGLAGNLDPDTITFDLVREHVREIAVVNEDDLRRGISGVVREERLIAEGAGAAGAAAVLAGRIDLRGKRAAVVLSGANIDPDTLRAII
jgi:threonine dehydratase